MQKWEGWGKSGGQEWNDSFSRDESANRKCDKYMKGKTALETYPGNQRIFRLLQQSRRTYCFEKNQNYVDLFHLLFNMLKFLLF